MEKPATSWFPTIPDLHPYVIACGTGLKKLSKIAGNSAICPCRVGQLM